MSPTILDNMSDQLAQDMADSYLAKNLDWDTCHDTMTGLFRLAYQDQGAGLTAFGWCV